MLAHRPNFQPAGHIDAIPTQERKVSAPADSTNALRRALDLWPIPGLVAGACATLVWCLFLTWSIAWLAGLA